jgi:spermidine synthase
LTAGQPAGPAGTQVIVRTQGRSGEVVLRRAGAGLELIVNGVFLMDTGRGGESERALAAATLAQCPAERPACLVGGLGFGYTVAEILALRPAARVTCVELEPAVLESLPLVAAACGHAAGLATDPRLTLVPGDVLGWARQAAGRYHAILLDTDNGPSWLVRPENDRLYADDGLAVLARALRPGGVLGVWSAQPEQAFTGRLARHFGAVREVEVPHRSGAPDVIYLGQAGQPATQSRAARAASMPRWNAG